MKQCIECLKFKPLGKFNSNGRGGKRSKCKLCTRDSDRSYRYGVSTEEYQAMLAAQCFACAICEEGFTESNAPCVDHDHSCCPGRVGCGRCNRGLICHRCNKLLGAVNDDPDILECAVQYLQREVEHERPNY